MIFMNQTMCFILNPSDKKQYIPSMQVQATTDDQLAAFDDMFQPVLEKKQPFSKGFRVLVMKIVSN